MTDSGITQLVIGRRCALYGITNQATGELYVGISYKPVARWKEHRKYSRQGRRAKLYQQMRVYGCHRFTFRVMHWFESRRAARCAEVDLIRWGVASLNMGEL